MKCTIRNRSWDFFVKGKCFLFQIKEIRKEVCNVLLVSAPRRASRRRGVPFMQNFHWKIRRTPRGWSWRVSANVSASGAEKLNSLPSLLFLSFLLGLYPSPFYSLSLFLSFFRFLSLFHISELSQNSSKAHPRVSNELQKNSERISYLHLWKMVILIINFFIIISATLYSTACL